MWKYIKQVKKNNIWNINGPDVKNNIRNEIMNVWNRMSKMTYI